MICFLCATITEGTPHDELEDDMAPGPGPMMADATTAKRALIRSRFSSYILHLLFDSDVPKNAFMKDNQYTLRFSITYALSELDFIDI